MNCKENRKSEGNQNQLECPIADIAANNMLSAKKYQCPAYGITCSSCGKGNHFSRVCQSSRRVHAASIASNPDSSDDEFFVGTIKAQQQTGTVNVVGVGEWISELKINDQAIKVKLHTGTKCNVIPKSMFDQIRSNDTLQKSNTN